MEDLLHEEQELRLEFRRCGGQLVSERQPVDKWEWYFLMRHYGVPTRLLDWTDGCLVALYFAVANHDSRKPPDAAVYMLDPWWLNEEVFSHLQVSENERPEGVALSDWPQAQPYLPNELDSENLGPILPLAIDPSHLSRRVAAQRSRFTIFGQNRNGLINLSEKANAKIYRFRIRAATRRTIETDLRTCGISESTIFPDLEGFGRELHAIWKRRIN